MNTRQACWSQRRLLRALKTLIDFYRLRSIRQLCQTLFLEWNPRYVGALEAHGGDTITVRLATGTPVTALKVPVSLGVKFFDFDSIERCLVPDLDSRYDLILDMAWLERHEP